MNVKLSFLSRTAGLLAGALLALPSVRAAEADALPAFEDNYITVSGQVPTLSGSHAAFQNRTQIARKGAGGIEEFNYTVDLSKATTLQVDGRALPGAEDYLAQFKLTKNEVGSFEAGYKRERTFYDGAGGFFPLNNAWLPIYPRALFVDRGKFFVNGTIALPNTPVFTFSYTNETRTGRKDSTIWGDTDQTGVPIYSLNSLNPISANRRIVPAYLQLGERRETWEVAVKDSFGKTNVRFAVIGNRINNLDTRSIDRFPGELKPFPAIPANPPTLVPPLLANNPNKGFDQQGVKENGLTWTGKIETVFSDKVTAYVSGLYRHSTLDTTGSRFVSVELLTGTGLKSLVGGFTPAGRPPYSQIGTGNMKEDVLTGAVGVELKPLKDLEFNAALKGEDYKTSGNYTANYVSNMVVLASGVVTPVPLTAPNSSTITEKPWIPEASVRYTGIKNVALFATWDSRTAPSSQFKNYVGITISSAGPVVLLAPNIEDNKIKEKRSNLNAGANWTPSPMLTLRSEFFTKDHENNFRTDDSYYILDYDTYGLRTTATVRATPVLSFSTRYVVQRGKGKVAEEGFLQGDSNDTRRYQLSETIDWVPTKLLYMQCNVNVVFDKTSTAYPRAGGSANDVLHNADNNFWDGSVVAGFVLDKETDAQIQGTYYKANNYHPSLAAATTPYGASGRDYSVTAGVKHKFSDRMVGSAKLGYFNSDNVTAGGFANFKGTVGYASLTYRL